MEKVTTSEFAGQQGLVPDGGSVCQPCSSHTHLTLRKHLDTLLQEARPRLLRLASVNRIPAETVEDVVQETLLEAWQHLEQLREPGRFASWLDGICRNVCRRQLRTLAKNPQQISLFTGEDEGGTDTFDLLDPLAIDPVAELEHQDLQVLLDRALGHLSKSARELVKLCYLAELPQREVAQRLQISLGALELRLHRGRKQLRQILHGELRAEARAFGLLLTEEEAMSWQQTRLWCWMCGKCRVFGRFERTPWGQTRVRLHCPQCDQPFNEKTGAFFQSNSISGLRSFRPALRRILQEENEWTITRMINEHRCSCQAPIRLRTVNRETSYESPYLSRLRLRRPERTYLRIECPHCGVSWLGLDCVASPHPAVRSFLLEHPRVLWEPDILVSYAGQDAISWRLLDLNTNKQLTVLVHPETLQVIAALQS